MIRGNPEPPKPGPSTGGWRPTRSGRRWATSSVEVLVDRVGTRAARHRGQRVVQERHMLPAETRDCVGSPLEAHPVADPDGTASHATSDATIRDKSKSRASRSQTTCCCHIRW